MEGSSDVEGDLVGEVYEYLVSGKYCDGASRERKRTIRKKALKFSVSNKGEIFYRQERKGKSSYFLVAVLLFWRPVKLFIWMD